MSGDDPREIIGRGADAWNDWRKSNPEKVSQGVRLFSLARKNLGGADLRDLNLSYGNHTLAKLSGADLRNANLAGANVNLADLSRTDLRGAKLDTTNLYGANLSGADLSGADLGFANLSKADLRGTTMIGTNLSGAVLVGTNLEGANLEGCRIYGISVWGVQLERTKQKDLVITPSGEPTITVDDLEVAQFIYLLLNHKKLRDVINTITARGVLILGRFGGGGLGVLQAIAGKLREMKYLPIIFDFDKPSGKNYTETVQTLVGLSRFVIVDLSGPSVPQELYATVPHFKIPFVPIIEEGRKTYSMATDILEYPWVLRPPVTFASTEELIELMPTRVVAPAEERHKERQKLLEQLFNQP